VDVHPDSYRDGSLGERAEAKRLVPQERDYFSGACPALEGGIQKKSKK
jgi:FtsZ-interacting cell division protein YlmF